MCARNSQIKILRVSFLLSLLINQITAIKQTKATMVRIVKPAPQPKPIAIVKNKYVSSSGSFIAERKRTIESAPTKPNDNAKEDLTTVMINMVVIAKTKKFLANAFRLERELPYFTYIFPKRKARTAQIKKLNKKLGIVLGENPDKLSAIKAFNSFILSVCLNCTNVLTL